MPSNVTPADSANCANSANNKDTTSRGADEAFSMSNPIPAARKLANLDDLDKAGGKLSTKKKFKKPIRVPFPWCCITKGKHKTTVSEKELMIRKDITYCGLSIALGAGYDTTRVEMGKISRYTVNSTKLLCCKTKPAITATMLPIGQTTDALLGNGDDTKFLAEMAKYAGPARGKPITAADAKPVAEFVVKKRCGMNTVKIVLHANGMMSLDDKQRCCTTSQDIDTVHLEDLSYIRYTHSGCLRKFFIGPKNRLELAFLGDRYFLETEIKKSDASKVHDAIIQCLLGRKASEPLRTWEGKDSKLSIGPEFTTVKMVVTPLCGLIRGVELITVKTADIAYLQATLPSWQNALIRAIRDTELIKLGRALRRLYGEDLALIMTWPFPFLNDIQIAITLFVKALLSWTAFILIFCCRKTNMIIGGPGPANQIAFKPQVEPTKFLRSFATFVDAAQSSFRWDGSHVSDTSSATAAQLPGPSPKVDPAYTCA